MEFGDNLFLTETCRLNHKFGKQPISTDHEFNPIENQHYLVKTYQCLKCGHIKLEKIKVNY